MPSARISSIGSVTSGLGVAFDFTLPAEHQARELPGATQGAQVLGVGHRHLERHQLDIDHRVGGDRVDRAEDRLVAAVLPLDRRREIVDVLTRAVEFSGNAQTAAGGWGYVSRCLEPRRWPIRQFLP